MCLQVESLEEDLQFIEDLLDLPDVWPVHQTIIAHSKKKKPVTVYAGSMGKAILKANSFEKEKSYEEYMSQLTLDEMYQLYTTYYNDFILFDYDPCDGL